MSAPAWRVSRTGRSHAFFGVRGAPACCGRVRIDDTRLLRVGETVKPCLVCLKRLDFFEKISNAVRPRAAEGRN
jgi:hypothetical protein